MIWKFLYRMSRDLPLQYLRDTVPVSTPLFSTILDFSRWAAAVTVLIFHIRNQLFTEFNFSRDFFFEMRIFDFFSNLGGPAVAIFFPISGLLIGQNALSDILRGNFDAKKYAVDRFTRIYSVFLPALLLTLVLDATQLSLITWPVTAHIRENLTLRNFFGNLLMLQDFLVKPFGSNGALWSLSYEWIFYCAFPAQCLLIFRRKINWFTVALLVSTSCLLLINRSSLYFYGAWLSGLLISNRAVVSYTNRVRYILGPLCFLNLFLLVPFFETNRTFSYLLYGLNFSLLLSCLISAKNVPGFISDLVFLRLKRYHHSLANMSFSLYAIHCPIIYFLVSLLSKKDTFSNSPKDYALILILAGSTLVAGYIFSLLIEEKRYLLRRSLYAIFGSQSDVKKAIETVLLRDN